MARTKPSQELWQCPAPWEGGTALILAPVWAGQRGKLLNGVYESKTCIYLTTQQLTFQVFMTHTRMFRVALLITARNWEKTTETSILEWIKKYGLFIRSEQNEYTAAVCNNWIDQHLYTCERVKGARWGRLNWDAVPAKASVDLTGSSGDGRALQKHFSLRKGGWAFNDDGWGLLPERDAILSQAAPLSKLSASNTPSTGDEGALVLRNRIGAAHSSLCYTTCHYSSKNCLKPLPGGEHCSK